MAIDFDFEMPTKGLDDLFTTQAEREDKTREKVHVVPFSMIDDFEQHPFKVRMDEEMRKMIESVGEYGILMPVLLRPKPDGRYEMVSGHRRKFAGIEAGLTETPAIIRAFSDEEAIIAMVDSNLQREKILPSEKAFAYKMKLDAMKQQGVRTDLTSVGIQQKLKGLTSREMLSKDSGESQDKIRAYIRLTNLITPVLEMVDAENIKLSPAVELSFLSEENQNALLEIMDSEQCTPSHAQAIRMKQAETGGYLNKEHIHAIMQEEKGNQAEQIKISKKSIERFFPPGTKREAVEETIVKALELYVMQNNRAGHDRDGERERGAYGY